MNAHANAVRSTLDDTQNDVLKQSLARHFFGGQEVKAIDEREMFIHVSHRLDEFRNNVVPWLAQFIDLKHAKVLELGAGTGGSIVALALAAHHVTGVDILEDHLKVARDRVALHGIENVSLHVRNAADMPDVYAEPFDLIVFSAVLEHMTYRERIKSVADAWANLKPGGILCIYETPNRLWYHDGHTSLMDFFHWLPDDVARDYAKKSPRGGFGDTVNETPESLARWGRGVSFHDVDLAIDLSGAEILESQHSYLCRIHPHYAAAWNSSLGSRYAQLLKEISPQTNAAFLEEVLNFALRKSG